MDDRIADDAFLADMREFDEAQMASTCRVLRPGTDPVTNSYVETEVLGTVSCGLVRPGFPNTGSSREATVLGREGDEPPATIKFSLGIDRGTITDLDVVEVTTPLAGEAVPQVQRFEVRGDPWAGDNATSLLVLAWRQDERHL